MHQGERNARCGGGPPPAVLRLGAVLASIGPLAGCGSDDKIELEVYSWWNRPSEAQAFDAVSRLHQQTHPHVRIDNQADPLATGQRDLVASFVLSRSPPATFTANIGADLLRWATVRQEGAAEDFSYVKDVSRLLDRTGLRAALAPVLQEALAVGDSPELYGVPINVHRLNVLYYHVAAMERLQEERPGVNLLSLEALCPESGEPDLPEGLIIAIGPEDFALILLTFESVLTAISGPKFYDALFRGETPESVTRPGESYLTDVRRALACVHGLSKHFARPDEPTWWGMLEPLRKGDVTFTVMGDWVNGELAKELEDGVVKAMPFPGSEESFVFTSDTFPLPIGTESEAEVVALLETIASPPAQRAFSSIKGSIPARKDAQGLGRFDVFTDASRRDFFENDGVEKVLATSGRFPPYYRQKDLGKALYDLTAKNAPASTIDDALREFVSQMPLFRRFQDRLQRGSTDPRP